MNIQIWFISNREQPKKKIFDNDWKPIHTATRRVSAIHAKIHLYRKGFNILNLFIIYIYSCYNNICMLQ